MTDTLYRWVKASERLGEFHDSDIPSWKFFNPDFCRVQGQPVPQGWFRKDIESGATVFSYYYTAGANFTNEIKEDKFRQIEWLEPYTPSPTTADASVLVEALEKIYQLIPEGADYDPGQFVKEIEAIVVKALSQYNALPGSQGGEEIKIIKRGIHHVIAESEGLGYWHTCSGCHESEDGHDVGEYYYSEIFNCKLGGGCHECGGIGAIWEYHEKEFQIDSSIEESGLKNRDTERYETRLMLNRLCNIAAQKELTQDEIHTLNGAKGILTKYHKSEDVLR